MNVSSRNRANSVKKRRPIFLALLLMLAFAEPVSVNAEPQDVYFQFNESEIVEGKQTVTVTAYQLDENDNPLPLVDQTVYLQFEPAYWGQDTDGGSAYIDNREGGINLTEIKEGGGLAWIPVITDENGQVIVTHDLPREVSGTIGAASLRASIDEVSQPHNSYGFFYPIDDVTLQVDDYGPHDVVLNLNAMDVYGQPAADKQLQSVLFFTSSDSTAKAGNTELSNEPTSVMTDANGNIQITYLPSSESNAGDFIVVSLDPDWVWDGGTVEDIPTGVSGFRVFLLEDFMQTAPPVESDMSLNEQQEGTYTLSVRGLDPGDSIKVYDRSYSGEPIAAVTLVADETIATIQGIEFPDTSFVYVTRTSPGRPESVRVPVGLPSDPFPASDLTLEPQGEGYYNLIVHGLSGDNAGEIVYVYDQAEGGEPIRETTVGPDAPTATIDHIRFLESKGLYVSRKAPHRAESARTLLAMNREKTTVAGMTVIDRSIAITFNNELNLELLPSRDDFVVYDRNRRLNVSSVVIDGKVLTLRFGEGVVPGANIDVRYIPGHSPITDSWGEPVSGFFRSLTDGSGSSKLLKIYPSALVQSGTDPSGQTVGLDALITNPTSTPPPAGAQVVMQLIILLKDGSGNIVERIPAGYQLRSASDQNVGAQFALPNYSPPAGLSVTYAVRIFAVDKMDASSTSDLGKSIADVKEVLLEVAD